jgi:Ca-activated chloride channel family protein
MEMKKQFILTLCIVTPMLAACSLSFERDGFVDAYMSSEALAVSKVEGPEVPVSGDQFDEIKENAFIRTADEPVSTFSVDADGAAYAYMRRCLQDNFLPNRNSVRIEEYLNYFTFGYADPTGAETLAINAEIAACPWAEGHALLRLGLKGKSLTDSQIPAANYIFLIDTSGSMCGDDRIDLLKKGLTTMLDYMKPSDRVAIITYSGSVGKALESTLVSDAAKIKKVINKLQASGCTAGGAAMKMAYDEAVAHYITGGNNRIIMCTDGDFNVGVSSTEALVEMVESYLDKGIYLSIMGFGTGNFQDSRMENLSNHGNGTYTYIDSEEEMMKVFVNERSHFYSVANDTKCQVTFDPAAVESYRLIGYENRLMSKEDFENEKKDAGEIGAGQTITALYEIVPAEGFKAGVAAARFDVRYKKALGGESRPLTLQAAVPADLTKMSADMGLAAGITAYGLCLRDSEYKGSATLPMARDLVAGSVQDDRYGLRSQLLTLMERASRLKQYAE